jgi:hypothetical protein
MMLVRISLAPFDLDLDPDPTFNIDADPDSAPHQRDADPRPLVFRPSTNPGLRFEPQSLHFERPRNFIATF